MDLITIGEHNIRSTSIFELVKLVPLRLRINSDFQTMENHVKSTLVSMNNIWFENRWEIEFDGHFFKDLEEQLKSDNELTLNGPYNISIHIGMKSFSMFHPVRWHLFLKNSRIQTECREISKQLVQSLGGEKAIYISDNGTKTSMYDQYVGMSKSLHEIAELMRKEVGDPATNLSDIIEMTSNVSIYDGYFLDWFNENYK